MLKYRPDIDGLRAIAVGSVVLYHLDETLMPGGFVGVDIFFVISGYLITKLIVGELAEAGHFSFKNFYLRRVRRLFPALFATLLFCLALSYALFSPAHLIEFGQSLIASIFSVSNFFFWSVAGYFDSDSSLKPLLHTWSLSVEEQFYLIWPALLVGLFSFKSRRLIPMFIVGMGLASLLLNILFFSNQALISAWFTTQDNQSALDVSSTAFYWLPFRVFEFSIGAILVWLGSINSNKRYVAEAFFALGLVMVLYSMFGFDNTTEFPSVAALLPCVGAGLMIYSGATHRLTSVVSNKLMVGIGLISYSLYLIHWPLIVYYKYWVGRAFAGLEIFGLIVAALMLAYLMYRFIEQPLRKPKLASETKKSPNRPFLLGALASTIAVVLVSASAVASQGWLWRYPADVTAQLSYKQGDYTEYFWANIRKYDTEFGDNGKPKVLVIGDSMAADLVNVLVAAGADQQLDLATLAIGENCKSMFGLSDQQYRFIYAGAHEICRKEHAKVLAKQSRLKAADTIVLATYWWDFNHLKFVPSTVAYLKTLTTAKIMVLGLKVQQNNGIWFLSKHAFSPQVHQLRTPPHPQALTINNVLKKKAVEYEYFDLLDLFCNASGCQRVTKEGYVIIFDDSHLSENGAKYLARKIGNKNWYSNFLLFK